jgi:hypothetical protein
MKHFALTISIDVNETVKTDNEIYDDLNAFFKEIYVKKPDDLKMSTGRVTVSYKKKPLKR